MTTSTTRPWRLLGAVLLACVLVLAACGGDDDDTSAASGDDGASEGFSEDTAARSAQEPAPEPEPESSDDGSGDDGADDGGEVFAEATDAEESEPADDGGGEPGGGGDGGAFDDGVVDPPRPDIGRSIIFTATVQVVVDDVPASASLAKTRIAGLGGLVFGEDTRVGSETSTTLEFKVFPQDFDEALRRLEGLGELRSQTRTADDVTERVVDLQSRITTAEASVDRLRGFLEGAGDLKAIADLELQLLERETDLEVLRGQLRTIRDQVDLATIFLTLTETAPPGVDARGEFIVTYAEGDGDGSICPGTDELEVDEGDPFTVCVAITNTGSNAMTDIVVRDNRLDLDPRDWTFLDEDRAQLLPVGETLIAFASTEAPANGSSRVKVSASAADGTGESLRIGIEFAEPEEAFVRFIEDDSLPGFMDALRGSWGTLITLLSVAMLVLAASIPYLWVLPLLWLLSRLWVRWNKRLNGVPLAHPGPPPAPATTGAEDG